MNSSDIFAVLALVTGIGVYLSSGVGSYDSSRSGGGKTIKRRHNKDRRTKSLRTKK
jgi:hypothetical protein